MYAADLDDDGDMDVLVGDNADNMVAWYENRDGRGTFGERRVIATSPGQYDLRSVCVADVDMDGDLDVLLATGWVATIAWYENTDGRGSFVKKQVISIESFGIDQVDANSVYAADLDGDGDVDVLSASSWSDGEWQPGIVTWYENVNGQGNFGPQQVIATEVGSARVVAQDLDDDGDMDVLVASWADDQIAWYENTDGRGNFGPQQIIAGADYPVDVRADDLDGDGDVDVLAALWGENRVVFYENLLVQISAGDANRDRRFDQIDIVQVLQAARYLTGGASHLGRGRLERRRPVQPVGHRCRSADGELPERDLGLAIPPRRRRRSFFTTGRRTMRPVNIWGMVTLAGFALGHGCGLVSAAQFSGLGHLPGQEDCFATAISSDGSVVVGVGSDHGPAPWMWTAQTGLQPLPGSYTIKAVSGDGSLFVGSRWVDTPNVFPSQGEVVLWANDFGNARPTLVPLDFDGRVTGVSDDGSVVVGSAVVPSTHTDAIFVNANMAAFRWTEADGMVSLGVPEGWVHSYTKKVSADGSTIGINAQRAVPADGSPQWSDLAVDRRTRI